jgi:hypothetical protein
MILLKQGGHSSTRVRLIRPIGVFGSNVARSLAPSWLSKLDVLTHLVIDLRRTGLPTILKAPFGAGVKAMTWTDAGAIARFAGQ